MAAPATTEEFLELVRKSGVADERRLTEYLTKLRNKETLAPDPARMAGLLVRDGLLTQFQAEQIVQGKWRRFTIGKYKVLEKLGTGGMGSVYLCEHKLMRRRVAVKVLPTAKANDESALERFYREARAVAALDHPNIVHAYDIDQDEQLHFLVMEYVDGSSLQDIVKKSGPLDVLRACHYIHQSALGLDHAHLAGLVHRDIKPGNILVERTGQVKILDMGLARFFNDEDDILTKKFDENVLGTADYLAPEQALDSHSVDIRADIYSLGATFYYMLTGKTPFGEGTVAQKLLWHQTRQPKSVTELRRDVPPEVVAVITKMMAKEPENRYQSPAELADAMAPFTVTPIGPPPDAEMPNLSPAALGLAPPPEDTAVTFKPEPSGPKALQGMGSGANKGKSNGSKSSGESANGAVSAPTSPAPHVNKPKSGSRSSPTSSTPTLPAATPSSSASRSTPAAASAFTPSPAPAPKPWSPAATFSVEPAAEPQPSPAEGQPGFWEGFEQAETNDAMSTGDTTPKSVAPVSSRKKSAGPANGSSAVDPRTRKIAILCLGAFGMLTVAGTIGYVIFIGGSGPPPAPVRKPFEVTRDSTKQGSYRSISQAIAIGKPRPGDVIQLFDEVHEENIRFDFTRTTHYPSNITVQAAPGKQVKWMSRSKGLPATPILDIRGAGELKIGGGITFDGTLDGKKRVENLVELYFVSPGLTLENLKLQSFDSAAIKIMNAAGEKNRPILIKNVEISSFPGESPPSAILLDAAPSTTPTVNDWIQFSHITFNGQKAPFRLGRPNVNGPNVTGVELPGDAKNK